MAKIKKFKRGQLIQNLENGTIYIFLKRFKTDRAHLIELDNNGDPVELVLLETKYLDKLKTIPETFTGIEIVKQLLK